MNVGIVIVAIGVVGYVAGRLIALLNGNVGIAVTVSIVIQIPSWLCSVGVNVHDDTARAAQDRAARIT